ncbi:LysR substrate-binding domain-containing protein [Kaistia dalseonensis]|uniref:LysR family hca operon transcriptional activator n=1 Tax=Kaistia dalseonensis TaxID=410840 RepID=A0ABU0HBG9_9HYPH|nr:LysR substrate-binding domain-containing protein [Kaistia dalseonensis]MCX5496237.1 LysR substrate-binding domain-containing protein [Kaistia dalseonensis]MDQ0438854.1 LysR family hca operon transcriptional activator [Kaistia dalseonensis]
MRYFVAVAEELSFTRAAERLHTAQPSLSHQIRDLEDEVGVELLSRNKRHVALTEAGRVFLDEARLVLAQAQRACQLARQAAGPARATLNVGFVPAAEVKIFPRVLPLMRASMPGLAMTFQNLPTGALEDGLLDGSIDIAFMRPPLHDDRLASETVLEEQMVAVIPADHRLAAKAAIAARDLSGENLVRINPRQAGVLHGITQDWLGAHGVVMGSGQEADNVLTLLTLVSMGGGVALLPDYAKELVFRNVTTRPLADPATPAPLIMAWRRADPSKAATTFRTFVCDAFGVTGQEQGERLGR